MLWWSVKLSQRTTSTQVFVYSYLSFSLTHLLGNASPQLPLEALINHELDSGVQHQKQGREGPVPQGSYTLITDDLHKCICRIQTIWKQKRKKKP